MTVRDGGWRVICIRRSHLENPVRLGAAGAPVLGAGLQHNKRTSTTFKLTAIVVHRKAACKCSELISVVIHTATRSGAGPKPRDPRGGEQQCSAKKLFHYILLH